MIYKDDLIREIANTNRGLLASDTDKAAILSAIARLEDRNPTPNPLDAPALLEGNWRLLYTTSNELLGIDRFPFYRLGDIYQCIRLQDRKIYNIAQLQGIPYLEGLVSVAAQFTPTSPIRVTVKFQRFVVGLQRVLNYQNPNQFIQALESPQKFLALDSKIQTERQGWLDITYLDETLRIGRGNVGSVFVLAKT
ncbi:MAG: PAP/fibrillin family protein [Phormidium sp. BM_Day4_Bin.17]|nr:PAP/fibrillin family protein [Phormidium sp. BM_Day4_Bin.17]UCJ11411.1 MAG: PAP/fibrillin family protein [Phormidium sp. PBR-2020]